jgi:DNA-directed RNA polymerase subunit H (RpoH/RPB5)
MQVSQINKYKCARGTIMEMLGDRGYSMIKPEPGIDEVITDLYTKMGMESSEMIAESDDSSVYVYFFFEKLGINEAKELVQHITENDYTHAIMVVDGGYTPFAEKYLVSQCENSTIDIELFHLKKLQYNVTQHVLQPEIEHIKDNERIKLVYKTFGITSDTMNLNIRLDDPINKYYNGKPGEMYKVSHKGGRIEYVTVIKVE